MIEKYGDGFLVKSSDLPLYGYGERRQDAINMFKREVESLFDDLEEDDNFSQEYLNIKNFLRKIVAR